MLNESPLDIFAISESKLYTNIHDDEIKIDGLVSYRLDRNRYGGCVIFYVNDQMESHLLKDLTDSRHESLWIKVCLDKPISEIESTDNLCPYLKAIIFSIKNFLWKNRFSFVVISTAT